MCTESALGQDHPVAFVDIYLLVMSLMISVLADQRLDGVKLCDVQVVCE